MNAVEPGPAADTVYVGGYFKTISGAKSKGITLLNTRTARSSPASSRRASTAPWSRSPARRSTC